jgi:hypothetical protein
MSGESEAVIRDLESTVGELRRELQRQRDKYERLLASTQGRAPAIPNWEAIADGLASDVVRSYDGHRTTSELQAYAAYLEAKS